MEWSRDCCSRHSAVYDSLPFHDRLNLDAEALVHHRHRVNEMKGKLTAMQETRSRILASILETQQPGDGIVNTLSSFRLNSAELDRCSEAIAKVRNQLSYDELCTSFSGSPKVLQPALYMESRIS